MKSDEQVKDLGQKLDVLTEVAEKVRDANPQFAKAGLNTFLNAIADAVNADPAVKAKLGIK